MASFSPDDVQFMINVLMEATDRLHEVRGPCCEGSEKAMAQCILDRFDEGCRDRDSLIRLAVQAARSPEAARALH